MLPKIFDHQTQQTVDADQSRQYLTDHGVHYEFWPVEAAPDELRRKSALTGKEKNAIVESFKEKLDRISRERGYVSHDLIVLNSESTENLEELLANFERVHRHTEDEVRFIVDGEGVFTLTRNGDTFSVTVTAGDLISVPVGTEHYFTLTESRNVKAIRLFQTKDGWVALYKDEDGAIEAR